jgi:acyl-CoA dehydrogenase
MTEPAMAIEAPRAGAALSQLFMRNPIFGGVTLTKHGSPEMKRDLLPKLVTDKASFAVALTEPDAGTNFIALETFARADDSRRRLSGRKIRITCVLQSTKLLVVAPTRKLDALQHRTGGISLFMIDVDRAGLIDAATEKTGTNTLPSSLIVCDDVRIEGAERVGQLDHGFHQLPDTFNAEGIVATGSGRHGSTRQQARRRCEGPQGLQRSADRFLSGDPVFLAEAHIKAQCTRLTNYKAATLCDPGKHYGGEANMGKCWLTWQPLSPPAALCRPSAARDIPRSATSNACGATRVCSSSHRSWGSVARRHLGMPRSY